MSDEGEEAMEFDLSLTAPVAYTEDDDDVEMLFGKEPEEWDWS